MIDLDAHFKRRAEDWDASPLEPVWLPRKWGLFTRRNKEAHAITSISCYVGVMYGSSLCGWDDNPKNEMRSGILSSEYQHEMPDNHVCETCKKMYGEYLERLKTFKHEDKAAEMRRKVANAGMLYDKEKHV